MSTILTVKSLDDTMLDMDEPSLAEFGTPALMRAARGAYARSIRAQLHSIGVNDLPRNGAFILGGIGGPSAPGQDLPSDLGVTKQAVSQLIDTLVNRGYLKRSPDPGDRRRIALELTELGQQAAAAVQRGVQAVEHQLPVQGGVQAVDLQLLERVSPEQIDAMRSGLLALADIKSAYLATGAGMRRRAPQLGRFSPIFPVRNLAAALAHYSALGFDASAYADGDEYGFANREGIGLHLAADHDHADHDHDVAQHAGSAYLYVRDADALYEEWSRPGIGGSTHPVSTTPYQLREGAHID